MAIRRNFREVKKSALKKLAGSAFAKARKKLPKRLFEKVLRAVAIFLGVVVLVGLIFLGGMALRDWIVGFVQGRFTVDVKVSEDKEKEKEKVTVLKPDITILEEIIPDILHKEPPPFKNIVEESSSLLDDGLVPASFSDLFSSFAWVNESRTTMYHDKTTTAFLFRPKFEWSRKYAHLDERDFIALRAGGVDVRCLSSGRCLSQNGFELSLEGARVSLPEELAGEKLQNISIGALDSKWLLGAVLKSRDGAYEGKVYLFDGASFEKPFGGRSAFVSKYEGVIGFGGEDEDWLAIYGGYEGFAYRVRSGNVFEDISRLFGYRVMDGGFHPVVARAGENNWYVFSVTPGKPRLIKLFSDKNPNYMAGAVDFTREIFDSKIGTASFKVSSAAQSRTVLLGLVKTKTGAVEAWEFSDLGFDMSGKREIASVNLNNYRAEVRSAEIVEAELYEADSTARFFLSNDGENWVAAEVGKRVYFPDEHGKLLFWGAEFYPSPSARVSPYFGKIRVDYRVKFL